MEQLPEKPLKTGSFVVHATRGVIRDQKVRRKMMFILLSAALLLLVAGSTFLAPFLGPHEHPWGFILFWFACGWVALTAMLLAVFDLLMIRIQARQAERGLEQRFSAQAPSARSGREPD